MEVKGVDTGLGLQTRPSETPLNGALGAGFDFHVGKPLQGRRRAEVLGGGISQSGLQLAAHGGQTQLIQLFGPGTQAATDPDGTYFRRMER